MSTTTTNGAGNAVSMSFPGLGHWLIRLPLAAIFIYHGLTKFPYLAAGAEMLGLPLWLWTLVAIVETGAGIGIVLGALLPVRPGDLLTRASGLGIIAIMIGAIALVHWGQWSNIPSEAYPLGGMEFQTLMLALGAYFVLRGNNG